jgi:hypothetical protein
VRDKYVQVEGHTSLVRDMTTGAIINTNRNDYERYMKQKKIFSDRNSQIEQINKHTDEINNIKEDLQEIKSLLLQMVKDR